MRSLLLFACLAVGVAYDLPTEIVETVCVMDLLMTISRLRLSREEA
jgi:hypothetical protein